MAVVVLQPNVIRVYRFHANQTHVIVQQDIFSSKIIAVYSFNFVNVLKKNFIYIKIYKLNTKQWARVVKIMQYVIVA